MTAPEERAEKIAAHELCEELDLDPAEFAEAIERKMLATHARRLEAESALRVQLSKDSQMHLNRALAAERRLEEARAALENIVVIRREVHENQDDVVDV